ncbi:MAG: F0F1 ATP synthase subunit epsilon [Chloroflexi bacterium]|nr:F0F1 ATP synthase subunit epsilon [Chloroflexota bacterium]
MPKIKLDIVTAEQVVYSDEVDMVVAPGAEGQLGILPRHAPLLTTLQPGELRIKKGGEETYMAIGGGFLEVLPNKIVILADTAERAEEIDITRAEAAKARAEERLKLSSADLDLERATAALRRSLVRLKVAQRRRRAGHGGPLAGAGP